MALVFGSPGRYVQGAGVIDTVGDYTTQFGSRVLVAGGKTGLKVTQDGRERSFNDHCIRQFETLFGGECCDSEILRLSGIARENGCDVLIAVGGGKVIDTIKAASENLMLPAIVIPTIAASDAPCSALAVIYNEDGTFCRLMPLKNSPALVLVDTTIIARSPVRQLVSGMGDAMATWFETEAAWKTGTLNMFGGAISSAAVALSKECYDTLLKYGRQAKSSCRDRQVTPALEKIVEANTLLSGIGFESGGVAVAHAVSEAFSRIHAMHGMTHGEKVAFGLIVHLIMEGRPADVLREVLSFYADVGLPMTLGGLGYDGDAVELRMAACDAASPGRPAHNLRVSITGDEIYDAILKADEMGRRFTP